MVQHGIDASGYKTAQQHYAELKQKMIQQVKNRLKEAPINQTYLNLNDSLEAQLLNDAQSNAEMTAQADLLLKQVEQAVYNELENGTGNQTLQSILKKIKDSERTKGSFKTSADERLLNRIKSHQSEIMAALSNSQWLKTITIPSNGGADVTDITNQITSYFTRRIYQEVMNSPKLDIHKQNYLQSLKGYYAEIAEYQILSKYLNNIMNVFHTGGTKITTAKGKVDTELDLIFSNINNLQSIMSKNISINQQIEAMPIGQLQNGLQHLRSQIDWFGEQSKSWSLNTGKFSYSIGNRANLLSSFKSEGGTNEYAALQGIQFLARQKNILLALGAANVLINTGGQRQWMADFISAFREAEYLLAFEGGRKKPLTQHIILTQLYNKSISINI